MSETPELPSHARELCAQLGIEHPIICGPMYPCSNPELVAATSAAGGMGVVQPVTLTYVNGYDFRAGLQHIRSLTDKPIGMNALIEKSSKAYEDKMSSWIDIALEEGVRFFITSLGNPKWVVERVSQVGGVVYHDVTERRWAEKGLAGGVNGLIAVNNRAGGHAGGADLDALYAELASLDVPVICAGGVGHHSQVLEALNLGYAGVQLGTAFIATHECTASDEYKQAIIDAHAEDIVLTEKLTGVPVSVIRNEYVKRVGTKVSGVTRYLLGNPRTKHWARIFLALKSFRDLKSIMKHKGRAGYWQAGKSADKVHGVVSVETLMAELMSGYSR